jgi:hypothetical protein
MIRQGSIRQGDVSRRALLRALGVSGSALALGGCASLGAETAQFYSSRIAANPTVLAATTRKPVSGGRVKPWYGAERGALSIARVQLTAPNSEGFSFTAIGQGEWAIKQVEPMRGQLGELIAEAQERSILLYIHGFRYTFEEADLRQCRIPWRHHDVLLAVQGGAVRLCLRPRKRDVVARPL